MLRVRRVVVAVVALLAACSTAAQAQRPIDEAWREQTATVLRGQVARLTGHVERSCGILWLDPQSRGRASGPADADVATASDCVLEARRGGRAAWAFWQFQGIDSTVFGGLATAPTSEIHAVHYDDYGGRPDMKLKPCINPRLVSAPTLRIDCDNRIRSLTEPELSSALTRLAEDVAATAGPSRRGVAEEVARNAQSSASTADSGFLTLVVDSVQIELENAGDNWPLCPRHGTHSLEFKDHRWFCVVDSAFLAELGGLAAIVRKPQP